MPARVEAVEDAELAFAQALVEDRSGRVRHEAAGFGDQHGSLRRAMEGRGQDDFGPLVLRQASEPPAQRLRLFDAERAERHVRIAVGDVDASQLGGMRAIARDVAGALAMQRTSRRRLGQRADMAVDETPPRRLSARSPTGRGSADAEVWSTGAGQRRLGLHHAGDTHRRGHRCDGDGCVGPAASEQPLENACACLPTVAWKSPHHHR